MSVPEAKVITSLLVLMVCLAGARNSSGVLKVISVVGLMVSGMALVVYAYKLNDR
jgi:hypothetical protein